MIDRRADGSFLRKPNRVDLDDRVTSAKPLGEHALGLAQQGFVVVVARTCHVR